MKGTKAQVDWAKDIRKSLIKKLERAAKKSEENAELAESLISDIKSISYAPLLLKCKGAAFADFPEIKEKVEAAVEAAKAGQPVEDDVMIFADHIRKAAGVKRLRHTK